LHTTFTGMDDATLHKYIKNVSRNINDEDTALILSYATKRHLKKGEALLKDDEICRAFYLVEKGYLRNYTNKDGLPINLNFTFEGGFTTNLKSIYSHQVSGVIIEAGEEASVCVFDLNIVVNKRDIHPQVMLFIRRLMAHMLLQAEEHINFYKMYTPTERYHYIEENNPQLLQRVSLSQIASYLGVTRETLSRIRAKKAVTR